MLSIIVPSRNEQFLQKTLLELKQKAKGEIEIIAVLDGYWIKSEEVVEGVIYLHKGKAEGLRAGINSAVAIAKGEYIMKIDGHCLVGEGFDEILTSELEDNWVVIPRRKRLDADNWCIQETSKPDVDYEYLSYPDDPNDFGGEGLNGKIWNERAKERKEMLLDENLSFQGSCWVMKKKYFYELDLMDEKSWGIFWAEAQEIGFKTWLSGGKVMTNKKTFYAHLHKGKKYGRGYFLSKQCLNEGSAYAKRWMTEKVWNKQILPFSSMIERFMPIPSWDNDKLAKLKENEFKHFDTC